MSAKEEDYPFSAVLLGVSLIKEHKTFRRKFDDFKFSSCIYCGHWELFSENKEDCIGNTHPACGCCLWAEGVLSCP